MKELLIEINDYIKRKFLVTDLEIVTNGKEYRLLEWYSSSGENYVVETYSIDITLSELKKLLRSKLS